MRAKIFDKYCLMSSLKLIKVELELLLAKRSLSFFQNFLTVSCHYLKFLNRDNLHLKLNKHFECDKDSEFDFASFFLDNLTQSRALAI